ncbi:MAG: PSD1 and planctomycete cytochrome C domain-containing protein [Phycisphaerales bacterium JB039]
MTLRGTRKSAIAGIAAPAAWLVAIGAAMALASGMASGPGARAAAGTGAMADAPVVFARDIRPILSDRCFKCHGPDEAVREANLRLDTFAGATAERPDGAAIVPGEPQASEILRRLRHADPDLRMPPEGSNLAVTEAEIKLIERWIAQGAEYSGHWSLTPAQRPKVPEAGAGWARNPIDHFVAAGLMPEGLIPSPEADRETLLRRVSLDLTGLPPAPEEIDAFLADAAPGAWERVVDRLLASDRYGEHMARYWMDAARYGDTHGLHLDNERIMWPWRDWVIEAFNSNMPFDQFTIEQLAGDLLPDPSLEQRIATGFNRNHVTTSEGGAIDAEYLVKYAADRTETVGTVWMGLTLECAKCHDHKFDPISQREYFQLFGFFNSITERAMDGNQRDPPPVVRAPTPQQQAELAALQAKIAERESQLTAPDPKIDAQQASWVAEMRSQWTEGWRLLEPHEWISTGGAAMTLQDDGSLLASGTIPHTDTYEIVARTDVVGARLLRLEALTDPSLPHNGPGLAENANFVLSEIEAEVVSLEDPSVREPVQFISAAADHQQMNGPFPVTAAIDGVVDRTNGWAVEGFNRREKRTAVFVSQAPMGFEGGSEIRVRLRFGTHFGQHQIGRVRLAVGSDEALVESLGAVGAGVWHAAGPFDAPTRQEAFGNAFGPEQAPGAIELDASYGQVTWVAHPEWADGKVNTLTGGVSATYLHRKLYAPTARTVTLALGSDDGIKVWLNGALVHEKDVARPAATNQDQVQVDLPAGASDLLIKIANYGGGYAFAFEITGDSAGAELLRAIDLVLADERSDEQEAALQRYFRTRHSPEMQQLAAGVAKLRATEQEMLAAAPTTLVMQERDEPMATYLLRRGEYDQPQQQVERATPAVLGRLPEDAPRDRLGLARWLVSGEHPLTARVTVNRLWQQVFGTGIVATSEDFGSQGAWPTHPELLDWLAVEFVESGWDLKAMLRLLVTSATYMQSSAVTPELLALDPENRLLARGPRFRLDGEVIRDQALAASGLLVEQIGGPSVRPPQPDGLWEAVAYTDSNTRTFMPDEGDAIHRRSLYTYWKRTSPPPNMTVFDAPTREVCTVRRARTNTPLQALALLNDPQFVEAARALAERALIEEEDTDARLSLAMRLVTGRTPTDDECAVLRGLYESELAAYRADPAAAEALLNVGEAPRDESLDAAAHAAMTAVASAILALDEAVTKG